MAVVDLVGSEQTARLALEVLANGGTYVSVGVFGGQLNVPWTMLNIRADRARLLSRQSAGTQGTGRPLSGRAEPTDSDTRRVDRKGERGPRRSARGSGPGAARASARAK